MSRAKIDFSKPLELDSPMISVKSSAKVHYQCTVNNANFPYLILIYDGKKETPLLFDQYGFSESKGIIIRNVPEEPQKEIDWEKPLRLQGSKQVLKFIGEYSTRVFPFCCVYFDGFGVPCSLMFFTKDGKDGSGNTYYFVENYEE